jgi:hypothetical protein
MTRNRCFSYIFCLAPSNVCLFLNPILKAKEVIVTHWPPTEWDSPGFRQEDVYLLSDRACELRAEVCYNFATEILPNRALLCLASLYGARVTISPLRRSPKCDRVGSHLKSAKCKDSRC